MIWARRRRKHSGKSFFRCRFREWWPGRRSRSCLSLGDFLAPLLLGGPSGIMISNIVVSLFGAAYNWPLGAAISLGMLVIVVSLLFLSERLEKKWSFS